MSIIRKEQLTNPLSASYALTASYALSADVTFNTSSLLITASATSNTITFTKGDTTQFSITVNTGSAATIDTSSLVTTSSFNAFTSSINAFTASYNTGSFSGSFTGSLNGTASWATNALTASSVVVTLSSNTDERLPLIIAYTGSSSGTKLMYVDSGLDYNTSTNALYIPSNGAFIIGNTTIQTSTAAFGSSGNQNHIVRITGSLNVSKSVNIDGTVTSGFGVNTIGFIGTASWAQSSSQALTASYYQETDPIFTSKSSSLATTGSNNFKGNQNITGSVTITGSLIVKNDSAEILTTTNIGDVLLSDRGGIQSIDVHSRFLRGTNGTSISINWGARYLTDSNADSLSVDWENRTLYTSDGTTPSLDWNNKVLKQAGDRNTVDWNSAYLNDYTDGVLSVDWENRILYAADGISPTLNWSSSLITTSPTFFATTISTTSQETFSSTSNYAGTVIRGTINNSVILYDLVFLQTDGIWYSNNQGSISSSKKLGIYLGNDLVLIEGHIMIDNSVNGFGPTVQAGDFGIPIFIRETGGSAMSCNPPSVGYVRILGHIYYQNQNTNNDFYIMRFNPSNDYYILG